MEKRPPWRRVLGLGGILALMLALISGPARATVTGAWLFDCTSAWSNWPGSGSGSCEIGFAPGVALGADDGGDPYALTLSASENDMQYTYDEPCLQEVPLPPLGTARGTMDWSPVAGVHGLGTTPSVGHYSSNFQWIRVGGAMVMALSGGQYSSFPDGHAATSLLPGVGVGFVTPGVGPTCANPGPATVGIGGVIYQPI